MRDGPNNSYLFNPFMGSNEFIRAGVVIIRRLVTNLFACGDMASSKRIRVPYDAEKHNCIHGRTSQRR